MNLQRSFICVWWVRRTHNSQLQRSLSWYKVCLCWCFFRGVALYNNMYTYNFICDEISSWCHVHHLWSWKTYLLQHMSHYVTSLCVSASTVKLHGGCVPSCIDIRGFSCNSRVFFLYREFVLNMCGPAQKIRLNFPIFLVNGLRFITSYIYIYKIHMY